MSAFIYILSSESRILYIGVTSSLERRMAEHQSGLTQGFAAVYGIKRLVYYEEFERIDDAIAREKQLKRWTREKKVALIETLNPEWNDLTSS